MALSIFDLDNTLITSDSDYLWGKYLVDNRIVDAHEYEEKNRQFFEDYEQGTLDIDSYLKFALNPLTRFPVEQLYSWRRHFIDTIITPLVASGAPGLLEKHRQRGDLLLIISATNRFITQPIADLLGVPHILATEPEIKNGKYTGNYIGTPTFQQGKVTVLQQWLQEHDMDLEGSTFYSDSHNDLPLLELVERPVAVNPDERLYRICKQRKWPIMDLRNQ
jgi:HAD superfamily hydrolase (TIGR01490 family)